ncbi:MAG: hypothetical protein QOE61_2325, partial [Micromonosporaceae bacterium]|nr:hypothetical protein [Micromonosporaceae bacterium]
DFLLAVPFCCRPYAGCGVTHIGCNSVPIPVGP